MQKLSPVAVGLIGAFAISGTVHLVRPAVFEPIVPHVLGHQRELVLLSGVAEIACAVGLIVPPTRRVAGPASAALLVAIVPANIQMAIDMLSRLRRKAPTPGRVLRTVVAVVRVPLQWPLIVAAWGAGRG